MHDKFTLNMDLSQPEIVYLIGYFWADCYFGFCKQKNKYEFSFEIKTEDFLEVWPLLQKMGFSKFSTRLRKNSLKSQSSTRNAQQHNMKFFQKWRFDRKSEGCPLYFSLLEDMKPFFIKGFLDGDGSISCDKNNLFRVGFNGPKNQCWDFLEDFCENQNIEFVIYNKDRNPSHISHTKIHGYSVLEFTKLQSRINFCKLLPIIGLKRKLNEYEKFKNFRLLSQDKSKFMKKLEF